MSVGITVAVTVVAIGPVTTPEEKLAELKKKKAAAELKKKEDKKVGIAAILLFSHLAIFFFHAFSGCVRVCVCKAQCACWICLHHDQVAYKRTEQHINTQTHRKRMPRRRRGKGVWRKKGRRRCSL